MNEYDALAKVISFMIKESKNKEYITKLNYMLDKVKGKKYVEEINHPRYLSIVFFGVNLFPYSKQVYIEMAELL